MRNEETSWESVENWYDQIVGEKGHYYHKQVILPNTLKLLDLSEKSKLLDLACGQGILARVISQKLTYVGIDASPSLIQKARNYSPNLKFLEGDVTDPLSIKERDFTHVTMILALQNISEPLAVLKNAYQALAKGGKLLIVLNHPCFRIPRQSSWGIDPQKKIQYRRIDSYLSPMKIPIQSHPSEKKSATTFSFHYPLSTYTRYLKEAGFLIIEIQEWRSDKKSIGKAAKMENRSRNEFPLFLAILAQKI